MSTTKKDSRRKKPTALQLKKRKQALNTYNYYSKKYNKIKTAETGRTDYTYKSARGKSTKVIKAQVKAMKKKLVQFKALGTVGTPIQFWTSLFKGMTSFIKMGGTPQTQRALSRLKARSIKERTAFYNWIKKDKGIGYLTYFEITDYYVKTGSDVRVEVERNSEMINTLLDEFTNAQKRSGKTKEDFINNYLN